MKVTSDGFKKYFLIFFWFCVILLVFYYADIRLTKFVIIILALALLLGLSIMEIVREIDKTAKRVSSLENRRLASFRCSVNISLNQDFLKSLSRDLGQDLIEDLEQGEIIHTGWDYRFECFYDLMSGLRLTIMDGKLLNPITDLECFRLKEPGRFSFNKSLMKIRIDPDSKIRFFGLKMDGEHADPKNRPIGFRRDPYYYRTDELGFFPIYRWVDGLRSLHQMLEEAYARPSGMFDTLFDIPRLIRYLLGEENTWEIPKDGYINMCDVLFKNRFAELEIFFDPFERTRPPSNSFRLAVEEMKLKE